MRNLGIILGLFIMSFTTSWAQESTEERLNEVIDQREEANELQVLQEGWSSYKLEDYETAHKLWMPLAEIGNPSAQVLIGLMYNQGHASELDINEAAKWYYLASKQGQTAAKWRLAMLYYHGSGLIQSYQKAAELYHSAAKQGDVYSQKALGIMYSKGFGVPNDSIIAYSWLQIATNNGLKIAQKYQNQIAVQMTIEEITIAKAMATECIHSGYTKCGWILSSESNQNEGGS